jgi:hypothetical protein
MTPTFLAFFCSLHDTVYIGPVTDVAIYGPATFEACKYFIPPEL